jgi:hypothetical protein
MKVLIGYTLPSDLLDQGVLYVENTVTEFMITILELLPTFRYFRAKP